MPHYNSSRRIGLEIYEEYCPVCDGYRLISRRNFYERCQSCNGKGIIDWIDNIKIRRDIRYEKDKDITDRR